MTNTNIPVEAGDLPALASVGMTNASIDSGGLQTLAAVAMSGVHTSPAPKSATSAEASRQPKAVLLEGAKTTDQLRLMTSLAGKKR